jgi:hypothetical protein
MHDRRRAEAEIACLLTNFGDGCRVSDRAQNV